MDRPKSVAILPKMECNHYQTYPYRISLPLEGQLSLPSTSVSSTPNPFLFMGCPDPSFPFPSSTPSNSSGCSSSTTPSRLNTTVPTRKPPQQSERDHLRKERRHKPQPVSVKRERNRRAASKCRSKALVQQQDLQERCRLLERENVNLGILVTALKEEAFLWKTKWATHQWNCPDRASFSCQSPLEFASMLNLQFLDNAPIDDSSHSPPMTNSPTHHVLEEL